MIQVGDKVRFSNKYLRSIGATYSRKFRRHRGKQKLMTVGHIVSFSLNWRTKQANTIVRVHDGNEYKSISTHWLRFVYRPNFRKSKEYKRYVKEMFGNKSVVTGNRTVGSASQ